MSEKTETFEAMKKLLFADKPSLPRLEASNMGVYLSAGKDGRLLNWRDVAYLRDYLTLALETHGPDSKQKPAP